MQVTNFPDLEVQLDHEPVLLFKDLEYSFQFNGAEIKKDFGAGSLLKTFKVSFEWPI